MGVCANNAKFTHPALTIRRRTGHTTKIRKYYQIAGLSPPSNYIVHNSTIGNLARAVLSRVLTFKGTPTPLPKEGEFRKLSYFRKLLIRQFPSTTPISRQSFVDMYRGRRRLVYQKALDSLLAEGITKRDSVIKAFVKAEFINSDEKPDPDPRVISPRDPRYNIEVGKFLKPYEHRIFNAINHIFKEVTVFKGYNARDTGRLIQEKWARYAKPVAIGLDASRFDQHVSVDALKWEHSVYNSIFKDKELKRLLSWQLYNDVVGMCNDGKLKYKTNGCRMSGDMNTALGNCLIMCALVHLYLRDKNIEGSLCNNGDDCVVIIEDIQLPLFMDGLSSWFLDFGFNMKIETPVFIIEKIEFCQTNPVYTPDGYIMCRNCPKGLAKDNLSLKDFKRSKTFWSWINAVGNGGMSLTGGIPIFQEYYQCLIRNSVNRKLEDVELEGGLFWQSFGMTRKFQTIAPRTRYSFWLAFGITPEQQMSIEEHYSKYTIQYRINEHDMINTMPSWFDKLGSTF